MEEKAFTGFGQRN